MRHRERPGRLPRREVIDCDVIVCRSGDAVRRPMAVRSVIVAPYDAIRRFERRARPRRAVTFRLEEEIRRLRRADFRRHLQQSTSNGVDVGFEIILLSSVGKPRLRVIYRQKAIN